MEATEHILLDETDLLVEKLRRENARLQEELQALKRESRYRLEEEREEHRRALKEERESIEDRLRSHQQRFSDEVITRNKRIRSLEQQLDYHRSRSNDEIQQILAYHPRRVLTRLLAKLDAPMIRLNDQITRATLKEAHPEVLGVLHSCRHDSEQTVQQIRRVLSCAADLENAPSPQVDEVETLGFFKELARQQNWMGQTVRLFASPKLPQVIWFDETLLREALLSLLREFQRMVPESAVKITLKVIAGTEEFPQRMQILLASDAPWPISSEEPLAEMLENALQQSETLGLEFLLARQTIDAHEGVIRFVGAEDHVNGFEVLIPVFDPPE